MIEFRKDALENQFNPNKLNDRIHLTSPSVYLLVATLLVLAGAIVLWGLMGSVTDKVNIGGVVYPSQGVESVSLPNKGVVRSLLVKAGDTVSEGQVLAMVEIDGQYSVLSSSFSGEVMSIMERQSLFEPFEPIATIQTEAASGMVKTITAFADFKSQRELSYEQEVQVNPTYLTREKNGYIPGRILSISQKSITESEALRKLHITQFAEKIFPKEGVAYEVQIELFTNPDNGNAFAWSFKQEKPVDMRVGTFCNVRIITKRRSMVRYMFESARERSRKVKEIVFE